MVLANASGGMSVISFNTDATSRLHKCTICRKTFKRREHRMRHERSHAQEKPYACQFCSRQYGRTDLVSRHEKTVHAHLWQSLRAQDPEGKLPPATMRSHTGKHATARVSMEDQQHVSGDFAFPDLEEAAPQLQVPTVDSSTEGTAGSFPDTGISELGIVVPDSSLLAADDIVLDDGNTAMSLDFFDPFLGPKFGHFALQSLDEIQEMLEPLEGASSGVCLEEMPYSHTSPDGGAFFHGKLAMPSASLPPIEDRRQHRSPQVVKPATSKTPYFAVTEKVMAHLREDLRSRCGREGSPAFQLPDAATLQKCMTTYIDAFHIHFPLIHLATLDIKTAPSPLILAMCAVGAQYRLERKVAGSLYIAAQRALACANLNFDNLQTSCGALLQDWAAPQPQRSQAPGPETLGIMQARWIVTFFGAFSGQPELIRQALIDCGHVATDFRMNRALVSPGAKASDVSTWTSWAKRESLKRLFCSCVVLNNLLSMTFGVSLAFDLLDEFTSEMPVDDALWEAQTVGAWEALSADKPCTSVLSLREAVASLFGPGYAQKGPEACWQWSPFATSVVMHVAALSVSCVRQGTQILNASGFHAQQIEAALSRCRDLLLAAQPNGDNTWAEADGPLLFNAFAALRVTYGRAFMGSKCLDRSLLYIASAEDMLVILRRYCEQGLERNHFLTMAVSRAADGFAIPVKSGIVLMRKTAALKWSIELTLAGWDAALLVTKWVHTIECAHESGLMVTPEERQVLNNICQVLADVDIECSEAQSVAAELARAWAGLFDDTWVWGVAPKIGWVLRELADMYDEGTGGAL
ncbi:Zinc finger protein [Paramyrothecium foliicola]|nr:Zinc finger protein [Paramyrothecium foliicola]